MEKDSGKEQRSTTHELQTRLYKLQKMLGNETRHEAIFVRGLARQLAWVVENNFDALETDFRLTDTVRIELIEYAKHQDPTFGLSYAGRNGWDEYVKNFGSFLQQEKRHTDYLKSVLESHAVPNFESFSWPQIWVLEAILGEIAAINSALSKIDECGKQDSEALHRTCFTLIARIGEYSAYVKTRHIQRFNARAVKHLARSQLKHGHKDRAKELLLEWKPRHTLNGVKHHRIGDVCEEISRILEREGMTNNGEAWAPTTIQRWNNAHKWVPTRSGRPPKNK